MSPPTRRCGLKFLDAPYRKDVPWVTSYAEVWIEIDQIQTVPDTLRVTSYAEVWIEIPFTTETIISVCRHLLRGGVD